MKFRILLLVMLAFVTALLAATLQKNMTANHAQYSFKGFEKKNLVRCTPDWTVMKEWIEEVDIPPIPGAGSYSWKICTKNDSAQFYFNQGINTYYAFHIIESMASFKKAARFDTSCAMLQWAQALAYGPNINDLGYAASPDALNATGKAIELSAACGEKEQQLILAQSARYSSDTTLGREMLNQRYADKMKLLHRQYPNDADISALYADALMLQHPWDLWNINGTPKPWTPQIRSVLEELLAKTPLHPGANHYYIHVMEPSPYAAKALPSANRLGELTPGLSHTVHMPSHIYLRTGYYSKGVSVNESAVNSYQKSVGIYPAVAGADFLYLIHNLHMQSNNAMLAGALARSVQSAEETMNSISKEYLAIPGAMGNYIQYIYSTPILVNIRFGRWNELLGIAEPPSSQVYANLLYHFGKGFAHASLHDPASASRELGLLQKQLKDSALHLPFTPFSAAIEGGRVAEALLAGTIAQQNKLYAEAIHYFKIADSVEMNMVYNEPRDWMLSPKHYLGNAYLLARKWQEAESVFRADLKQNNENGWALYGLYQALMARKKTAVAAEIMKKYRKAFTGADVQRGVVVF
jgi:tetratricopeptide (TPR) repeat protein